MGLGGVLGRIVHPRLHLALKLFYPSEVVIQQSIISQRPNGEQVMTWVDFLTGIQGNLAQLSTTEQRSNQLTRVPTRMALNLNGYYPTITNTHRAVVDGVPWGILGVIHDSLSSSTRLDLEIVVH